MLTKEQIDILTDNYITGLYDDLESVVIGDIARRVKKMQRFTETAELMAVAMREQGYSTSRIQSEVYKAINADPDYQRELVKNTREYKQEIKQVIEQTETEAAAAGDVLVATAGDMSWNDDMQAWKLHDIDLKRPNGLDQLFRGMQRQTARQLRNITQTTGFKGTALGTTGVYNAFVRTMDMAVMKVATGTFSYQTACEDCVRQLAMSGLRTIDYSSGRSYQLDTAARMCVRTGMAQLSGKIQELNLQNGDTPLVYVDAHAGSRPEHAEWQGKVYAYDSNATLKDGSKAGEKYGDFFNETDYGSVTGLMGANCSHHFYPYWEGDPIPEFTMPDPMTIDGKEYTYYEATQEMRRQERNIRATRREIEATNALGGDTSALKRKLKMQESAYMDFSEKSKINPRQYALGVQTGTSNLNKTKAWQQAKRENETPEKYKDETDLWSKRASANTPIIKEGISFTDSKGNTYFVDGTHVFIDHDDKERDTAKLLSRALGVEVILCPRVTGMYSKVQTPDYLAGEQKEKWDRKGLSGSGKDALRDAIKRQRGQADHFIIDISSWQGEENDIIQQARNIFTWRNTEFVQAVTIIRGDEIVKVFRR